MALWYYAIANEEEVFRFSPWGLQAAGLILMLFDMFYIFTDIIGSGVFWILAAIFLNFGGVRHR